MQCQQGFTSNRETDIESRLRVTAPLGAGFFILKLYHSMKEKPSFYAVLPASVRYDEKLSSSEKLFYAEITAMSESEGYCWASNSYFAKIFGVSTSTISSWGIGLRDKGHILIKYEREGKNITKRLIYPIQKIDHPYPENPKTLSRKSVDPYPENPKENNTSINGTSRTRRAGVSLNEKTEAEYQRYKEYMKKENGRHVGLFQEEEQRLFLSKCRDPIGVIKRSISNGWMKLVEEEKEPETKSRYEYF